MFKFTKYIEYVLLAICCVIIVLFYVQSGTGMFKLSNLKTILSTTTMTDGLIWWTYALCALAILLVLALSIFAMVENPKSLKKTGFTLGLAIVLIVASYFLASGAPVQANVAKAPTAGALKLTDTILILTYILMGATILVILGGAVVNMIKKR